MNTALKMKEAPTKKQVCKIIQFPKKQLKKSQPSISCCKTDLLDWDFSRGF